MARMIPPGFSSSNDVPPGEKLLFERFRDDPGTKEWIVLHSLDLAQHTRQVSGEIDFVVLVPGKGVLCLEVKSHSHISCRDGVWSYGSDLKPGKNPFRQASDAMHSLRTAVATEDPELASVPFWTAVAFPFLRFVERSREWHQWQVIDQARLGTAGIGKIVLEILGNARKLLTNTPTAKWFDPGAAEPTRTSAERLLDVMRPSFEVFEAPASRRIRTVEEVKRFTEAQFGALDAMERNPRVIFDGPAGTGKTFLLMEAARRACDSGKNTLVLCYNRMLGRWLANQLEDLSPRVEALTVHSWMMKMCNIEAGSQHDGDFFSTTLPEMVRDRLLSGDSGCEYEHVLADEGQDIFRPLLLDVLDLALDGGLRHGSWFLFGDFANQRLYRGEGDSDSGQMLTLDEFRAGGGSTAPVFALRQNCRNTQPVAWFVQDTSGMEPRYAAILRPYNKEDKDPSLDYYEDDKSQATILEQVILDLLDEGYHGKDIVLLSPLSGENSCAGLLASSPDAGHLRQRLKPLEMRTPASGDIGYTSIFSFKGMEAPAVVVTDLDGIRRERERALLYVACSRPLERLHVICHSRVEQQLAEILTSGHKH